MRTLCLWLAAVLHYLALPAQDTLTFYVAPGGNDQADGRSARQAFATLEKARNAIRQYRAAHQTELPVKVCLLPGDHFLQSPLQLGPEDGGTAAAPVIYTSCGPQAVINGGRRITGWQKFRNNIWVAPLPESPQPWSFRQLFVNGERRNRARFPDTGFYRVTSFPDGGHEVSYHTDCQRFGFRPGDIRKDWKNLQDVEVIVYHFWTDSHLPIQEVDEQQHIVTFRHKAGKVFTDDFSTDGARYIVENVFEGLTAPGEWYLDKEARKVYYIPRPGEDMRTLQVWAPVTPAFLQLKGDPKKNNWIQQVHFRNLAFRYANFELPPGNANDQQGSSSIPAVITLEGARYCSFRDCNIGPVGGFAFELKRGCSYNSFAYNRLHHLGAGAFKVNGGGYTDDSLNYTHHTSISDNEIGPYGVEFPSAVGVLMMRTYSNEVTHNHIFNGGYTGISVGWEWGYRRSISRDNIIAFNHIHDIGQGLLSDMGGIYTLGISPGTVIRNNVIHHVNANKYGGWGIYNDEGSSNILVENNVVYSTKFAPYNINYGKDLTVRNNIFALGRLQQLNRTRAESHISVYFERNIVYWETGVLLDNKWKEKSPIPDSATLVMDRNLYYNPRLPRDSVRFNGATWADWQRQGKDVHSLYADPLFTDPQHGKFGLRPGSPALKLGFRAIDASEAGPRRQQR